MSRNRVNKHCPEDQRPARVLVVDDLPASRLLLYRVFSALKYDVSLAADGEEAWYLMVSRQPFDIVLTDLEMPALDGLQLAQRIRKSGRDEIRDRPVIIHSSTDPAQLRDPIAADPLTFCLPKPLEVGRLKETLVKIQEAVSGAADSTSIKLPPF